MFPHECFYAEAVLAPGTVLPLDPDYDERAIYVASGEVDIAGQVFGPGRLLVFRPGDRISVLAISQARLNQGVQVKTRDGTGMVFSSEGHIVTAIHVVEKANKITVVFPNNSRTMAQVVGADPVTGIAMLKVSGVSNLTPVHFGDAHPLRRSDSIFSIGTPFGLRGSVVTGVISALRRTGGPFPHDLLQPSFPVLSGDDGAPLFNLKGEVVGMITGNYARSGRATGIGLAVISNIVREVAEKLQKSGTVERGWLGVQLRKPTTEEEATLGLPHDGGAFVVKLLEDGPASKSGLSAGDVITTLNGEPVRDVASICLVHRKPLPRHRSDAGNEAADWEIGCEAEARPTCPVAAVSCTR